MKEAIAGGDSIQSNLYLRNVWCEHMDSKKFDSLLVKIFTYEVNWMKIVFIF